MIARTRRKEDAMKFKFLLVALLLLLGVKSCFSLEATFSQEHACVPAGEHVSSCEIRHGNTLWRFARNSDSSIPALMRLNPQIVNANLIYAGRRINLPDSSSQKSIVIAETPAKGKLLIATKASIQSKAESTQTMEVPAVDVFASSPMGDDLAAVAAVEIFSAAPAPAVMLAQETAPIETANNAPSPAPSPSPTSTGTATVKEAKRISGYKLTIPENVFMAMGGIPLKYELKTEILTYASEEAKTRNAPNGYSHLRDSWAQKEGDNIILYVPKNLPNKPFNLFITGIKDPIDGSTFLANAETFQEKFPGPHRAGKRIFSGLMLGANGYMMANTLGPVLGPSIMGGMLITRELMKHHAEASLKKAEDKYNATLAGGNAPSQKKELGQ